jgi:DNA-directed RNA polymerase subunit RPC12/RpoP
MNMGEELYKCPKCGSQDSVWRGYRYNESGKKRLRKCKNCGSKFSPDDGFRVLPRFLRTRTLRKFVDEKKDAVEA